MVSVSACQSCKIVPEARGILERGRHFMPVLGGRGVGSAKLWTSLGVQGGMYPIATGFMEASSRVELIQLC